MLVVMFEPVVPWIKCMDKIIKIKERIRLFLRAVTY
jgi:hypothetical protein